MARGRSNFKMGTVEMIILFLLDKGDFYGYQLTTLIKRLSEGSFVVTESTLYPTMYKLLDRKFISDYEQNAGKRRIRVYYHLEEAGRGRLSDLLEDYREITRGIERILACTELDEGMLEGRASQLPDDGAGAGKGGTDESGD